MQIIETTFAAILHSELLSAAAVIFAAVLLGMLAATLVRRFLMPRFTSHEPGSFAPRAARMSGTAVAAIIMAGFNGMHREVAEASLLLGAALGIATAMTAYQIARALEAKSLIAMAASLVVFVLVLAGTRGGLQPLAAGLDSTRLGVGSTAISLLDIVNTALIAILLFVATRTLIRILSRSIASTSAFDPSQRVLFQKFAQIAVVTVAVFIGIDVLGIDLTALAVFSGAFGLAIGFGLQKTFGNLLAGLILLMDRSIKPGDVISVGDTFGWVNKIGVRAVSVLTRDGKEHLIPNEQLMTTEVENWSYSSRDVRVHVGFSVSYDCDLRLVQRLAVEAATAAPRVLEEPKAVCWVKAFGESAVEFDLRIWIDDPEAGVGNIVSDVFLRIWDSFKANGIKMPYPQRDLHLRTVPPGMLADNASE
jgi:small-conductance mechanosensitive channel